MFMTKMMINLEAQANQAKGKVSTNSEIYDFGENLFLEWIFRDSENIIIFNNLKFAPRNTKIL